MANRKCPVCKADVRPATLPQINGEEGRLAVTVHRMPVLQCAKGHRLFAHPDFPLLLLDRLVEGDEKKLPASDAKGMLIKHHHCAACGERLIEPDDRRRTFHLDVELPDTAPFDVELTMPVHRCSRCGHEQVHSLKEVRSRTPAALAHAFKSAEIAAG
jgi:hypothetical protein